MPKTGARNIRPFGFIIGDQTKLKLISLVSILKYLNPAEFFLFVPS